MNHDVEARINLRRLMSGIFQGSPDKIIVGHSLLDLENSEKLKEFKSLDDAR